MENLTVIPQKAFQDLDMQEFQIDVLESGSVVADAPGITTVTTSSWVCVTVTIVSISVTQTAGCIS
jgi:hypothetical protein